MLNIESFRSRLNQVKDNPTEVALLAAEMMADLSVCLQEIAPYLPADSSLIANSRVKEDKARIEEHHLALERLLNYKADSEMALTRVKGPVSVVAPLTCTQLADGFALLEVDRHRAAYIFMNARDYADVRKFGQDILDLESRVAYLKMGVMGKCWGADIVVMKEIPVGTVYFVPEVGTDGWLPALGVLAVTR